MVARASFRTNHGHLAGPKGGWVSDVWMTHVPGEGGTHQLDLVWHQHKWAGRLWAARLVVKSWVVERRGRPVCWCERAKLTTGVFEEYEAMVLKNRKPLTAEQRDDV